MCDMLLTEVIFIYQHDVTMNIEEGIIAVMCAA